jgi:hypothetical protein
VTGRFGGYLESAIRVAERPHEHGPERPVLLAVDQEFGEGAPSRSGRGGVPVSNSSPVLCQGFAQASRGLMVARGGRMIAAISVGIIIIVAVIVASLAIIYFVLKGSPR